jgi:hypothetical protein
MGSKSRAKAEDPQMNHRRLRLPAAIALMALAAPVFADDQCVSDRSTLVACVQRQAHELSDSVRQNTRDVSREVSRSVHQFRHQFTRDWYRTSDSIHRWWKGATGGHEDGTRI